MKDLREELRGRETPSRSVRWYQDNIRKLGFNRNTPTNSLHESNYGEFVTKPMIGSMYLYVYDPKTKEKLPYYDRFPLVFPFNITNDGFTGINLHYLPPMARMVLLNKMMSLADDSQLTPTTRLQLSWDLLKNYEKFPGAIPCTKRYLNAHIRTRLMKISPLDWRKTIMLPIDRFQKASNFTVWRNSRRDMHG